MELRLVIQGAPQPGCDGSRKAGILASYLESSGEDRLQLLARFGPLVLMLMGIAASFAFPRRMATARWSWLALFLIVGVPVSVAAFRETQATGVSTGSANGNIAEVEIPQDGTSAVRPTRPILPAPRAIMIVVPRGSQRRVSRGGGQVQLIRPRSFGVMLVVPRQSHQTPTVTRTAANTAIPANTLSCTGFTRNDDGTWNAGGDTQPFAVGNGTNYTIRNQGPIGPRWLSIGNVDLYALLNAKCGAATH
jgi:hypothetical protein